MKEVGEYAFSGCSNLNSVLWNAKCCNDFTSENVFKNCDSISVFEFSKDVERIPAYICSNLIGLNRATIGESVIEIGDWAFWGCNSLTNLTIPKSITAIGLAAFLNCTNLERIDSYPNPDNVFLSNSVFTGVPKNGTLHVLPQYLSTYQTANQWNEFYNISSDLQEQLTIRGDVNGDGEIDGNDLNMLINIILGKELSLDHNANVNGDDDVNGSDINDLINILLGK